jgi:CO/xanthine dehydrogenase FAD-binding subunit
MAVTVPATLDEALAALGAAPAATVLAGGTDLLVEINEGHRSPDHVLALRAVPELRGWTFTGGDAVIGAATTYTDLMASEIAAAIPALAAAARTVGSPQIRNAGTIGGNLATASPAGDTLPVLVALGASVEIAGAAGRRVLPVTDFFVGPKRTALQPGELVVAVRVPVWRGPQDYLKVGVRNAMVIAVASVALALDVDKRAVGIGLGSVGPTPLDAPDAAAWLRDRLEWRADGVGLADPADLDHFGSLVADAARPIDDHRSTAAYRRHAVGVLARRALRRALAWRAP